MSITVPPTKNVRCVYSTVLNSKATRYFAIAPVRRYETLLSTQLKNDVTEMVLASTGDGACCAAIASSEASNDNNSSGTDADAGALTEVTSPCVCLGNVTLLQINSRYADRTSLLGLTFEVYYAVYVLEDGKVLEADSSVEPATPFLSPLSRRKAFSNIVKNLFHALTRKEYLSELALPPNVFAHMTLDDLERILHNEDAVFTSNANWSAVRPPLQGLAMAEEMHRGHAWSPIAGRAAAALSDGTDAVDYCTTLFHAPTPVRNTPSVTVTFNETNSNGTTVTYSYSLRIYQTAQGYGDYSSSGCDGTMCSLGILCGILMIILIFAAGVAFVVQRCRRSRSERKDEQRLFQRQLR